MHGHKTSHLPIRYFLALLWAHPILHISTIRVKYSLFEGKGIYEWFYTRFVHRDITKGQSINMSYSIILSENIHLIQSGRDQILHLP